MKASLLITIALFISTFPVIAQAQDSKFATLSLPLGVRVDVPKNWWILSGDINASIETAGEAAINLIGADLPSGRKTNLFRANSMPKTTYAGIAINASDADIVADDIRGASATDLAELTPMMKEMMQRALSQGGLSVLDFYPIEKRVIDGHPALIVSYRRTGPQGPVIVRMTRLVVGDKEIRLNLSYRESESVLWKPVIGHMEKSLRIQK